VSRRDVLKFAATTPALIGLGFAAGSLCAPSASADSLDAESPDGTSVTTVGPTINASTTPGSAGTGNVFAITSGGQVSLNGVVTSPFSGTSNVAELYYTNHTAYWEQASGVGATVTYSNKPDTANANLATTTDTGSVPINYGWYTANGQLCIKSSRLTYATPGYEQSGFCQVSSPGLPGNVNNLTTTFTMNCQGSPTTNMGVIAMIMGYPAVIGGPGYFGVHLVVSQTWAQIMKYTGSFISLGIWNYSALPLDNTTIHTCQLVRSGSTATVYLDGVNLGSCTDPDIQTYSRGWCAWEVDTTNPTDNVPGHLSAQIGWEGGGGGSAGGWFGPMTASSAGSAVSDPTVGGSTGGEASPDTAVTTVGATLNASPTPGSAGAGNIFSITSGGQVALGGTVTSPYTVTGGVAEIYYIDHTAFQRNTSNAWYGPMTASSPGNSTAMTGSPHPTLLCSGTTVAHAAPSGTTVGALSVTTGLPGGTVGTGAYTWSYALSGTNASSFTVSGANLNTVGALADANYTVTVTATSGAMSAALALTIAVGSPESAPNTSVTTVGPTLNASPTPGSAGSGNIFAITSGGQVSLGGTVTSPYTATGGVVAIHYIDHTAFQQNSAGSWYGPMTASSPGGSSPMTASPHPTVLCSGSTVAHGAASGTTVGAISVTTGLPNGSVGMGAYTWTLALSGTNAASFTISGSSLNTVGALADGTYSVTITATSGSMTPSLLLNITVGTPAGGSPG
jgi:hypothetical protein